MHYVFFVVSSGLLSRMTFPQLLLILLCMCICTPNVLGYFQWCVLLCLFGAVSTTSPTFFCNMFSLCLLMYACVYWRVHSVTHSWKSEDCSQELFFSFHHVGSGDGIHVVRSGVVASAFICWGIYPGSALCFPKDDDSDCSYHIHEARGQDHMSFFTLLHLIH